jgi:hypothetical protein
MRDCLQYVGRASHSCGRVRRAASAPELPYRLIELSDGPEDLPDQGRGRRVGCDQLDTLRLQRLVSGLLHDQVAREAAGVLEDDCASAVAEL